MKIYPNPCSGRFVIQLNTEPGEIKVNVKNILGQDIPYARRDQDNSVEVRLNSAAKGVYFMTVESSGIQYSKKIMVE